MLPLRDAVATTGNARADGSGRPPAVVGCAGVGAAGFHQKYPPPATIATSTITANAHAQRRRTGVSAGTGWDGKSGSGAGEGPDVIVSFAGDALVIVPDYR